MRTDGIVGGAGGTELVLLGEGQRRDGIEAADVFGRAKAGGRKFRLVETRAGEQAADLTAIERVVEALLVDPGTALDVGIEHRHGHNLPGGSPPS